MNHKTRDTIHLAVCAFAAAALIAIELAWGLPT